MDKKSSARNFCTLQKTKCSLHFCASAAPKSQKYFLYLGICRQPVAPPNCLIMHQFDLQTISVAN